MEERESVIRIRNAFSDYDQDASWNEANSDTAWADEPKVAKMCSYLDKITNLKGIEFFPNLYEIQLVSLKFDPELTELVITNPNLEIIELVYQAKFATIDLSNCNKLRTCVIRSKSEIKPSILVPETLEVTPLYLYDCAIGKNARDWISLGGWDPTPTPFPPEALPEPDYAIKWESEKIEQKVRDKIDIRYRDIMLSDVYNITEFVIFVSDENNISDLANLKNLKKLSLHGDKITDISPLAKLKNLEELELDKNKITDISPLAELKNLEKLELDKNKITDISPLANLPNLKELRLADNNIEDVSALASIKSLTDLYIFGNNITDISALVDLPNLEELSVGSNRITNIDCIQKIESLVEFHASKNPITTVQLSGMPKLQRFDLERNSISEITLSDMPVLSELFLFKNNIKDVSGLTGLKKLSFLDISENPVENIELMDFVRRVYD